MEDRPYPGKPHKLRDQKVVDTVVIGGGFAGLSAALDLARSGRSPIVLECSDVVGGMAGCFPVGDTQLEHCYHHIFPQDGCLLQILNELRLSHRIHWKAAPVGFYIDGRLHEFTSPIDILRFSAVGMLDRLRFAALPLVAACTNTPRDDLGTAEWLKRIMGNRGYDRIMAPLMQSKFGLPGEDISAAFIHGRVTARMKTRGGCKTREKLGYIEGGMGVMATGLAEKITELGGSVLTQTPVTRISNPAAHRFKIETPESVFEAEHVVFTAPIIVLQNIWQKDDAAAACISAFRYRSLICVTLGLDESPGSHYWINVADKDLPFGVVVEHTHLLDPTYYHGDHIVYAAAYTDSTSPLYLAEDGEVLERFQDGLDRVFPHFKTASIRWTRVFREPSATPVFSRGYANRLQQLKGTLPSGLHLAGNLLTYPGSRNVNAVVLSGKKAAGEILNEARS